MDKQLESPINELVQHLWTLDVDKDSAGTEWAAVIELHLAYLIGPYLATLLSEKQHQIEMQD
jgi:hypothetical protein